MKRYCAIYMPEGSRGSDRYNFKTEEEAWEYSFSRWCDGCQEMYKRGETWVPCSGEWMIYKMDLHDWWRFLKIKCHIIN